MGDLESRLEDWRRHLRAKNRSSSTIESYLIVGRPLASYLTSKGMPTDAGSIAREHVEANLVDLVERLSPATTAKHYRLLQQFFRWFVEDGEIPRSPMERMSPPAVPERRSRSITGDELGRLLAVCSGNTFENRRDTAIIRLLVDTGMRAGELVGLTLEALDFDQDVALVMGKGRRAPSAPFDARTADTLRRYIRARARYPLAGRPELWLGKRGPMTDSGVRQMLERRATEAGVENLHPHRFRPTFAHRWLVEGGQEARPHAACRLAKQGDARPLRSECCRRAGSGGTSKARPR